MNILDKDITCEQWDTTGSDLLQKCVRIWELVSEQI